MREGSAYNILTDEPTGKRLLRKSRNRKEAIIRMYLKENDVSMTN